VATATAEQVRGIVDAAERSAGEIRSKAEREADEARRGADRDASATRERAGVEAAAHVQRVEEATTKLLERARAIDSELDRLVRDLSGSIGSVVATVRDGAGSLSTRLEQMRNELSEAGAGRIARGEPDVVGPETGPLGTSPGRSDRRSDCSATAAHVSGGPPRAHPYA
jgi:hypothetical protein